jgi:formyltetrahydrofolate-dependent phosphoribosylglycinamide formyltransferase
LGVLLSGRGSNFQAILKAQQAGQLPGAEIALVLSNKAAAEGLAVAQAHQIPTEVVSPKAYPDRREYDARLLNHLREARVDVIVLAGYTRVLSDVLLHAYPNRILNIHPSLLPAFGGMGMVGMKVHEAVIHAYQTGEVQTSGCSVHLVTETVDGGPVLGQAIVTLEASDTPETLAAKVLAEEHRLYPQVLGQFIQAQGLTRQGSGHDYAGG